MRECPAAEWLADSAFRERHWVLAGPGSAGRWFYAVALQNARGEVQNR